ncbi:MAG: trypsin-like peptidase domain-containing protein [Clostridia bacterium]|nr:trypsin-like peptidase domain-containing protein [Clostridia bacterium]
MEDRSYDIYKEKKNSNVGLIVGILCAMVVVSIISSAITYSLMSKGQMQLIGANNTTYTVENVENPVVAVAEITGPSVVGVSVTFYEQSFWGELAEGEAEGSGVIYSEDGYIITNYHVIQEAVNSSNSAVKVTLANKEEYEATIVGADETTDLALLKIEATGLTPAKFADSDKINVGEYAIAIGNPLGKEFAGSVTVGYISAVNRTITADGRTYNVIQTDAAINPGNSGGALVNSKGEVVGINTVKISDESVEGLGFAIPSNYALKIIEELKENGKIVRPYIGIYGIDLDKTLASKNNLVEGVYIYKISANSPAQELGLQRGDVIVEFDGQKVLTINEINTIKNEKNIGDKVKIKVYRDGDYKEGVLTLGSDENVSTSNVTN